MNDLETRLEGRVELKTNHPRAVLKGPFEQALDWPMAFRQGRRKVDGSRFPALDVSPPPPPVVSVAVQKVGLGSGEFDPASGTLLLPIELRVDYPGGFATVVLKLSTAAKGGTAVDMADGSVTLVAKGKFVDPVLLNGIKCTVSIQGRFETNPRV